MKILPIFSPPYGVSMVDLVVFSVASCASTNDKGIARKIILTVEIIKIMPDRNLTMSNLLLPLI